MRDVDKGDAIGAGIVVVVGGAAAAGASQTSSAGPYLTFAGAILVALITWIATDRRQARQLREERARLTEQLAAETVKLDQQFAHERRLRDLDALRAFLDDAATVLDETVDLLNEARVRRELPDPNEWMDATQLRLATARLLNMSRRFGLRMLPNHPMRTGYRQAATSLSQALREIVDPSQWTDARAAKVEEATSAAAAGVAAFTIAAVRAVGVGQLLRTVGAQPAAPAQSRESPPPADSAG